MQIKMFNNLKVCALMMLALVAARGANTQTARDWQTPAEKSDYRTTPNYAETRLYLQRLAQAAPNIKLTTFGKTGENRDLLLVIAANQNAFTPELARRQNKPIVLVQAAIHAGEADGKDAGLALLRDIAITKTHAKLLDKIVLLFVPIYNADGHERRSKFNRINQNGPEETGWRGNARNINLNRDYMKADEPETRAWLKLWNEWQPDLFVDCHVTDGADYQYDLTYQFEHHQTSAPAIKNWLESAIEPRAVRATEANGHLLAPYLQFRDNKDYKQGIDEFLSTPRFATGYTVLRSRPSVLIETHALKPTKTRVLATRDFLIAILQEINQNPDKLLAANKEAEAETHRQFQIDNKDSQFPLALALTEQSTAFAFKGVESKVEPSEISGASRVIFDSTKPLNITIPFYNQTRVAAAINLPSAYIVPPQWTEVIERFRLHGVEFERLPQAQTFEIETYRLTQPKWATNSFESRIVLRDFKTEKIVQQREFPAGSILIKLQQLNAPVAVHLLEPAAPDSLVRWGFFNSIFEQKEYGEPYILEKLAREMIAKNPDLKREFEEKLKTDEQFAKNAYSRLTFFFERSKYFDKNIGLYPVGRVVSGER